MGNGIDTSALTSAMLELSSDGLLALSLDGEVLALNKGAVEMFGGPEQAPRGLGIAASFQALFAGRDSENALRAIDCAREGGFAQVRVRDASPLASGGELYLTMQGVPGADGRTQFIAVRGERSVGTQASAPPPRATASSEVCSRPRPTR